MPFKIIIGEKGKAWRIESTSESIVGKAIGDKISGSDIDAKLEGYEFEITGGTDIAGFPMYKEVEGIGLKRVLFTKGWGMKDSTEGMRRRKSVRGKVISDRIVQINLKVSKHGHQKLSEIFAEQNVKEQAKSAEQKAEAPAA